MMTPQDLKDKEFVKAVFGGYDMAAVDDFLERITEDYSALYKETAVLKSKLKVLVEKVEEYRSTEDSMRMALLTAQKMANEMVEEAKAKSDAIVAEANEQAQQRSAAVREELSLEEARLVIAQKRTSEFSQKVLDLVAGEAAFLEALEDMVIEDLTPEPPPQIQPEPVSTVPEPVELEETSPPPDEPDAFDAVTAAEEQAAPEPEERPSESSWASDPEDSEPYTAFSRLFDQDHIDEEFSEPEQSEDAGPEEPQEDYDSAEEEKLDIARSISASLGDEKAFQVDTSAFWDDEGEPTTTRPKFDFDDLQFGKNLQDDE